MSGQSIVDRLNAAKHTVAGSALGRAVVKATTEEIIGPKRKHLDYLLQCTSEINVSIPQMADLLIERTQNTSWVVTFKSLITIHHLMCYGNERFSQYMASHSSKFSLNNFMDRNNTQGIDMSSYIRKYAHYLNEKRETYKLMGFDFCKVKRGKDDGLLRTMNTEKLIKTLPVLQKQLEALVAFDVQPNELNNGVINSCFVLMSKDLIRLFACYNDGIINLLEKFFEMNKKNSREALDLYKKFLEKTDNVSAFLKVAESSGMDKSDIPDLTKAPGSLLEALEAHVNSLENKKSTGTVSTSSVAASNRSSTAVTSAINSLNNNTSLTAEEKRRVIEEEAKTLEQYKHNHLKKQTSATSPTGDPFTSGAKTPSAPTNQNDLFGLDLGGSSAAPQTNGTSSASDDLLMLSGPNPFIQNIVNQSYNAQPPMGVGLGISQMQPAVNPFQSTPGVTMPGMMPVTQPPMGLYSQPAPMNNFASINAGMNTNQNQLNDLFSGLTFDTNNSTATLNTTTATNNNQIAASLSSSNLTEFDVFGDVLQPTNTNATTNSILNPVSLSQKSSEKTNGPESKIISNDLESSLASLADNLDINNKNKNFQKNHQWNGSNQQSNVKTGGQNWAKPNQPTSQVAPMAAAWSNPMTPMGGPMSAPMNSAPMNGNWVNANPFGAPSMQPVNQMGMASNLMNQAQIRPTIASTNNPFDLF